MNDISIIFCTNESVKENIREIVGKWSEKGLIKNFIFLEEFQNNSFPASVCVNGNYTELKDLKTYLSNIDLDFIRTVSLMAPENEKIDIQSFINYLNLPSNIKFCYLNTIIPETIWHQNKVLNAGTHLANANILISPIDRPNPTRVPVDIVSTNYSYFASVNLISVSSLWRGMKKSPFDNEELNMQGKIDYIVTRNFVRVLLGPDPVDGLIDSLTTDQGKWITPNKNYSYPNNDAYLLTDFALKIIDNYEDAFNFNELPDNESKKMISFFEYFKRRYSQISLDKPLPLLSTKNNTLDQIQELLEDNSDKELAVDDKRFNEITLLSRTLISSLSLRGKTSIPKLWRDIRSIIFSLLDGSNVQQEYSEFKQNIVINNVNSIVPKNSYIKNRKINTPKEEELLEIMSSDIETLEEGVDSNLYFFDNFKNKLKDQSVVALSKIRESIEEIINYSIPDEETVNLYKKFQKRAKFMDRFLLIYLFNVIIYFVNQILINGGYVDIILNIPFLDQITPDRLILFSFLGITYWVYVVYKLYDLFKNLNKDGDGNLRKLSNASIQLVEFSSLLEQFKIWEEIYRILIHESLDKTKLNLEIDDTYIDFSPLLSIKGAVGNIQREVIEEIQMSIVKEGWFLDIYNQIESDFKDYSTNKILRIDENLIDQIDSEETGLQDEGSIRYLFYRFLIDGNGNDSLKYFLEKNVKEIIEKTDSSKLFSESLNSGKTLSEFLKEIEQSENPSELQFDQNIWSNEARVFQVQEVDRLNRDDAGSSLYSIQSGSPIQRVIVRTDTSARVPPDLIGNFNSKDDYQDDVGDIDFDNNDF